MRRLLPVLLLAALAGCFPRPEPKPWVLPDEKDREGIVHVAEAGETWAVLAEYYYGDSRKAAFLQRRNKARGVRLAVGMKVRIPMTARQQEAFDQRALARVPYNDGVKELQEGQLPEAIISLRRAISQDPRLAAAHFNLGLACRRAGSFSQAEEALQEACRLRPRRADYRYALGTVYFDVERWAAAATAFEKALAIDAGFKEALWSLAEVRYRQGRIALARRAWRRYLKQDPDSVWGRQASERLMETAP